jgi:penicillin-binding protein 1B
MAKNANYKSSASSRSPIQRGRRKSSRRRLAKWLLWLVGILTVSLVGAFVYFYTEATTDLDQWMQGTNRSVNPSNIYARPLTLRVGQRITPTKIVDQLRLASYSEATANQGRARGTYRLIDQTLEVVPGNTAVMDRQRVFPHVRIEFDAKQQQIDAIVDDTTGRPMEVCQIEPILISTITRSIGRASSSTERGVRYEVTYQQLPVHLVNAVLTIEDKSFFQHRGVNVLAIVRALWRNLQAEEVVEGGSTITQQLIKNILVGSDRSYERKFREAFLALALERRLTKEEIFTQYANIVYLGYRGGLSIYGLGAAAREYFNKDVSQLERHESALLAGMIHRPAYYLLSEHQAEALRRRNLVLEAMREDGLIAVAEAEEAKQKPLGLRFRARAGDVEINTPYFIDYVQEEVARLMPDADLAEVGYRINTTLDLELQRAASIAVGEGLAVLDRRFRQRNPKAATDPLQAALVVLEARTGDILAMVGGRSYSESQFNRVTNAQRQPGSAIKPFVYASALASGVHEERPITLATTYTDEPKSFETGYAPENFGGRYLQRPVTVREALTRSLNVITVALAQETGYGEVAGMIGRCGLPRPDATAATALGAAEVSPLELASAYTAFVAGGRRTIPISIRQVADSDARPLRPVTSQSEEVMTPQVAFMVLSVLQDVIRQPYGTAHEAASLGDYALAGKTGTSQRSDAWYVGLTPSIVCVAWVGFDDNRPMNLTGSAAALPIWISLMRQIARLRPELLAGAFTPPPGLIERPIDPTTGMLATRLCPEPRAEFFLAGRELTEFCAQHPGPPLELPFVVPTDGSPHSPANIGQGDVNAGPQPHHVGNSEPPPAEPDPQRRRRPRRVMGRPNVSQQQPDPPPPVNPQP